METQTITIISGIALLAVFVLVGVVIRRRNARRTLPDTSSEHEQKKSRRSG